MAATNGRTTEQVRRDIEAERERLAIAADDLRAGMDVNAKLKDKLPVAAAAALGIGFVFSGGIGATMRLLTRRSREGKTKARFGPFSLVDRD
jgi:GH24 family phage-related lysozyme (muramidase)